MTKFIHLRLFWSLLLFSGLAFTACKSKSKENAGAPTVTAPDTAMSTSNATAVQIAPEDSLQTGVRDATKDFPLVNAAVADGTITLTGEIKRAQLPTLMKSLNSLHPKKINNQLTIK